jgi:hypothetical protein
MALTNDELKELHDVAVEAEAVTPYTAKIVATLYAALLNVPVPTNNRGIDRFSKDQAFELTKTLAYESLNPHGA